MDTKKWGPAGWTFMFTIASNYPTTIDVTNKDHRALRLHYKAFFQSIEFMLPCKYCRQSYHQFIAELPIDDFLSSRRRIVYWLYLIKDKVNRKLIAQERESPRKDGFKTQPSPPFKDVMAYYASFRAKCSDKTKTCVKKK